MICDTGQRPREGQGGLEQSASHAESSRCRTQGGAMTLQTETRTTTELDRQLGAILEVAQAVARGDLSQKIAIQADGPVGELADTINAMVGQLSGFSCEVIRVARELGTEGRLGGQATVPPAAGIWRDLTDSVNPVARNLTAQG